MVINFRILLNKSRTHHLKFTICHYDVILWPIYFFFFTYCWKCLGYPMIKIWLKMDQNWWNSRGGGLRETEGGTSVTSAITSTAGKNNNIFFCNFENKRCLSNPTSFISSFYAYFYLIWFSREAKFSIRKTFALLLPGSIYQFQSCNGQDKPVRQYGGQTGITKNLATFWQKEFLSIFFVHMLLHMQK